MNEEVSDVAFKIQEKTIPARKEVLIQKSKYFENLFKSRFLIKISIHSAFIRRND